MASSLSEVNLEKKFKSVTNTQDGIQTLSLWLMHHKVHHKQIVKIWLKVLRKAKVPHRLTLIYVANDVVQNSKRKSISVFKESFAEVLKEATVFVRDETIRESVNRVFGIWVQRSIYSSDFIDELQTILMNIKTSSTGSSKSSPEFKSDDVINKLKLMAKLENETASKATAINLTKLDATNAEIVQKLKDRKNGQQFQKEFDENARLLEEVLNHLNKEMETRNELILLLEQSEHYYDKQRGEAKIVVHAFKNYENRIRTLQKKLDELFETFPSPLPSPCVDAPSPTTSDLDAELMLPDENTPSEKEEDPTPEPDVSNIFPVYGSALQLIGNQIPTLTNLFPKEKSEMPSWLDTFANKTSPKDKTVSPTVTKANDTNSLDTRLSNLLQNLPNLPVDLQTTLFGTSATETTLSHSATNSPATPRNKPANTAVSFSSAATTPVKDEYSGQNTPLLDEDTPLSASASFFTQLRSNKGSQSPKDKSMSSLKGLTNLIHSVASPPFNSQQALKQKDNQVKPSNRSTNMPPPQDLVSPGSPSRYLNPPQSSKTEADSVKTTESNLIPVTYPEPSNKNRQNFSFIPSLANSSSGSGRSGPFGYAEYDPTVQNYEMDMELDSGSNSPPSMMQNTDISPTKQESNESHGDIDTRSMPSALITLVANAKSGQGSTMASPTSSSNRQTLGDKAPINEPANNWPKMLQQEDDPNVTKQAQAQNETEAAQQQQSEQSSVDPRDRNNHNYGATDWSSKIETVQSLRTIEDTSWHNSDWNDPDANHGRQMYQGRENFQSYNHERPFKYYNYHHQKDYQQFHGGNQWQEHEGGSYNDYDYRQKQHYQPFPSRRRGWRRNPQY